LFFSLSSQNKRRRVTTPVNHRSKRSGNNPAKVSDHSDNCPSLHLEACQCENLNNLNKNRTKRKCKQKKGTALKCKSNKIETTIVTEGDKRYGMKELEEMTCFHEKQDENKSLRIPVEVHLESTTPIRCPVWLLKRFEIHATRFRLPHQLQKLKRHQINASACGKASRGRAHLE
jgi:hypothetical protein